MSDGTLKKIKEIKENEFIQNQQHEPIQIKKIIRIPVFKKKKVTNGDLKVTSGHPIFMNSKWKKAKEYFTIEFIFIDFLFNFILEKNNFSILVGKGNIICATIGCDCDGIGDWEFGKGYRERNSDLWENEN